ncbi:MAG: hypothetical protein JWM90_3092 [Thermoleophilia bacterium]|nr:hypothetical protein [Thermoleophilia bacterium]
MDMAPELRATGEPRSWYRVQRTIRTNRFLQRYEERRAERQRGAAKPYARPIRVTIGVLLILGGAAIGWLPGPGFVILGFPGALLVASEWRRAALILDRVENETIPRFLRLRARLRGGPKREWVEADPGLWADWCDRRGQDLPDTGARRREADAAAAAAAEADTDRHAG